MRYKSEKGMEMMRAKMFELEKATSKNRLRRRILLADSKSQKSQKHQDIGLGEVIPQIMNADPKNMKLIRDRFLLSNST